jgi:predicted metal-binding membrane protein
MQETLLPREKWLIVGVLVILTMAAWGLTIYQSRLHGGRDGMEMATAAPHQISPMASSGSAHGGMMMPAIPMDSAAKTEASPTLILDLGLFLTMWVAMMIAMMFPSAYPMVLLFARVSKGQTGQSDQTQVPTWIFVAGYVAIWTLTGGLIYLASLLVRWVGGQVSWIGEWAFVGSAMMLMGAGHGGGVLDGDRSRIVLRRLLLGVNAGDVCYGAHESRRNGASHRGHLSGESHPARFGTQ